MPKTKRRSEAETPPTLDIDRVTEAIDIPFEDWAHQCHAISLAIVKAGLVEGRVVRGSCQGVVSQHSWIVPVDFYNGLWIREDHWIIDPTLWSYDASVEGIWYGSYANGRHHPHGAGSIWEYGKPVSAGGPVIELTPGGPLSRRAQDFLRMVGPLDREGWSILLHAPVEGWPAGEIIAAAANTKALGALVPIDIQGNYTDHNPQGLYLPAAAGDDDG